MLESCIKIYIETVSLYSGNTQGSERSVSGSSVSRRCAGTSQDIEELRPAYVIEFD